MHVEIDGLVVVEPEIPGILAQVVAAVVRRLIDSQVASETGELVAHLGFEGRAVETKLRVHELGRSTFEPQLTGAHIQLHPYYFCFI
jgi:hypothetical protein